MGNDILNKLIIITLYQNKLEYLDREEVECIGCEYDNEEETYTICLDHNTLSPEGNSKYTISKFKYKTFLSGKEILVEKWKDGYEYFEIKICLNEI